MGDSMCGTEAETETETGTGTRSGSSAFGSAAVSRFHLLWLCSRQEGVGPEGGAVMRGRKLLMLVEQSRPRMLFERLRRAGKRYEGEPRMQERVLRRPQRSSRGSTADSARWWEVFEPRERATSATAMPMSKSFCSCKERQVRQWIARVGASGGGIERAHHADSVGIDGSLGCSTDDVHHGFSYQEWEMEGKDGVVSRSGLRGVRHGELPHHHLQPLLCDEDVDSLHFYNPV